jgi:hypothetical protein
MAPHHPGEALHLRCGAAVRQRCRTRVTPNWPTQIAIARRRPIRSAMVPSEMAPNSTELTMNPAGQFPMMMQDRNNLQGADFVLGWIARNVD